MLAKAVAKPFESPTQASAQPQLALVTLPSVKESYYRLNAKLSDAAVILYWHPAEPTSAIAFITTTRKEILAQEKADEIDVLIKSKLLTQDEQALKSTLWWSLTVPPDFDRSHSWPLAKQC